jgi:uncharacterized protein YyaL (SSP411 family)
LVHGVRCLEKILYDNAFLVRLYLRAFHATGKPPYQRIAKETLEHASRQRNSRPSRLQAMENSDGEETESPSTSQCGPVSGRSVKHAVGAMMLIPQRDQAASCLSPRRT